MLIMDNWGHAYENMNSAARELHERYRQFCIGCSKAYDNTCSKEDAIACNEKRIMLMKEMLDISDIRLFCVVTYDDEGVQRVRHLFRVEEQSLRYPHQLREEYYSIYSRLPDDRFHFFRGYHRAKEFAESLA